MNRERQSARLADTLAALSRASVAEMLREMGETLRKLAGCAYLSPVQERHIGSAARHINAAVAEWIGGVMAAEALRTSEEADDVGQYGTPMFRVPRLSGARRPCHDDARHLPS